MKEKNHTPAIGDWLKATDTTPPDSHESAREVAARLPRTRQLRRWWPPPFLERASTEAPGVSSDTPRPTSTPATNGHTPTVTGRTQSMFSPAKAITAGALVFAIGGVLLIAQPFDQQGASVPGAAETMELVNPIVFSGTVQTEDVEGSWLPEVETEVGLTFGEGGAEIGTIDVNTPLLSGDLITTTNDLHKEASRGESSLMTGVWEITNEGGRWIGTATGANLESPLFNSVHTVILSGMDGYGGLTAYVVADMNEGRVEGMIIPGDMPPVPEPYVVE